MAPKDFNELSKMLEFAVSLNSPVVIRYPRGGEDKEIKFKNNNQILSGKAENIKEGQDITIIAIGKMVAKAKKIANILEKNKINAEVINSRFLKPFDNEAILKSIIKTKRVITIEDGIIEGGLASKVNNLILENNLVDIKLDKYGYPVEFIKHGKTEEIEKLYGLDEDEIAKKIIEEIPEDYKK